MSHVRRWMITVYAVAIFSVLELPVFGLLSTGSLGDDVRAVGGLVYVGTWIAWLILFVVAIWRIRGKAVYLVPSAAVMLFWPVVGLFALRQFNFD